MSDNGHDPEMTERYPLPRSYVRAAVDPGAVEAMRRAAAKVMRVESVTTGSAEDPLVLRGALLIPSDQAFTELRPQFEAVGHTPLFRRENDEDVVRALPVVFGQQQRSIPWLSILLLIATIICVFLVGVGQADGIYDSVVGIALAKLTGNKAMLARPELLPSVEVWRAALLTGVQYTLALLGILGTHEMGHYLMARRYGVDTTLPFFIPLPPGFSPLGTLGAVIAMREPSPNRRVQFDIGVAGPLAGLVITIPVLLIGLSMSDVSTRQDVIRELPAQIQDQVIFSQEGQSLVYLAAKYLVFGEILPRGERDVFIHAVAFAGWAGLLVTALNLIPIGQLDGGHVLYGLFGKDAQKARRPIIVVLIVLAIFGSIKDMAVGLPETGSALGEIVRALAKLPIPGWSGWWIWILLITFMIRGHAPVLDEITELDPRRRRLGVAVLVIFILIFTPIPLVISANPLAAIAGWFA